MSCKHSVKVVFSLVSFLVILSISGSSVFIDKASGSDFDFIDPKKNLEWTISHYHSHVNDLFNSRFKAVTDLHSIDFDRFRPVAEGETCQPDNLSTYCLAEEVTKAYIAYRKDLLSRKSVLFEDDPCDGNTVFTVVEGTKTLSARGEFIDGEIEYSKSALDLALAVYSEFQTMYPMHKKYEEIYKSTLKYREGVYEIRRNLQKYPALFQDVSTPRCT